MLRAGGRIDDGTVAWARARGVSDAELSEIVGHVALNVLSNYFNHVARPDLDFPAAAPTKDPAMNTKWRSASRVALVDGYTLLDANGTPTGVVENVRVAIEGGFLHIQISDSAAIQVISAPAVAVVTYRAEP